MYGKIFASLYQGTLRGRAHEILVFTNMIACSDQHGVVDKHPKAIAEEIGLPLDETRKAIASLEAPDPESRTAEHGGARIIKAFDNRVWGWQIVNYAKYRAIRNEEDRREQNRIAQARWRDRNKPSSASVSQGKPPSAEESHDKPKEKEKHKEKKSAAAPPPARQPEPPEPGLFDPGQCKPPGEPPAVTRALDRRTFADWRVMVGKRCFVGQDERAEWLALYAAEGWDSMSEGYAILAERHPEPAKLFLSMFQEIRE